MTATTLPTPTTVETETADTTTRRPLLRAGLRYGLVAAAATTAVAIAATAVDVPLEADGKAFPILGFAQLTLLFTFVGVGIAKLCRTAHRFTVVTVALTALSLVPDITLSATDTATKVTLMLTHLVAAAIVIPGLRSRLIEA